MALNVSSIKPPFPADCTPARKPAARNSSTAPSLAQRELAQTLAAASKAKATASSGSAPAAKATTTPTTPTTAAPPAAATSPADPPTAQSVFGSEPWEAAPTGSGPTGSYNYNPYYFATPQTAAEVAAMVGGTVVAVNALGGPAGNPYVQDQPNEMVRLSNGAMINPGLVASFYTHGYPQSMVDQMVANEVANVSKGN
ncbi:MAG TPA: hypothetical protein VKF41_03785 [Bryobacteraceae bacterium]|nr:hypothetical protein [Bryobacteraceae bacterium]